MNELEKLSRPLIKYLEKNYNSHTKIEITQDGVKVLEETMSVPFPKEIKVGITSQPLNNIDVTKINLNHLLSNNRLY